MSLNINYTSLKKGRKLYWLKGPKGVQGCGTEKEVQMWERFFLSTSLFRASVEWLTSVIALLFLGMMNKPSNGMDE